MRPARIGLGLCILLAATAIAHGKVTVVHWHNSWAGEEILNYLHEMEEAFEAEHPGVDVVLSTIPGGEYADKLVTAHVADVAPDVAEWWPGPSTPMVIDGLFEDLRPFMERDGIRVEAYIPGAIASVTWEQSIWGIPSSGYPVITMYNKDLWDEAGLADPYQLGDGWTWDAVLSTGRKLTKTAPDGTIEQYATLLRFNGLARAEIFAYQAGGAFFDRTVNPTESLFDSDEVLTAFTWMNDVARRELTPIEFPETEWLITGQAATMIKTGPQGLMSAAFQDTPGVLKRPIGVAPMPKGPVHNGTGFITDCWMLSSSSKHKPEAWEWLKFIGADADHLVRFVEYTGRLPSLVAALGSYVETLPEGTLHGEVIADVSVAPTTRTFQTQHPNIGEITGIFQEYSLAMKRGEMSPEAALEEIDRLIEPLL